MIYAKSKFIAQGTYGCTYIPDLPCSNKPPTANKKKHSFVSKLQRINPQTEREETIGKIIKEKIKRYNSMYGAIIESCPVNISEIEPNELEKCAVVTNNTSQYNNLGNEQSKVEYKAFKMRNAGKSTIGKYFLSLLDKNPKKIMKRIFETHIYLLKSLDKLSKLEPPIIHYDLKNDNIMYNEKLNVPIIIDFGLSFELDTSKEYNRKISLENYYIFYEKYPPWCIELILLSYIVQTIVEMNKQDITSTIQDQDITALQNICYTFINENEACQTLTLAETNKMQQGLINYVNSYLGKTWKDLFNNLQKSYSSWDNYSLAVMFLFYIKDMITITNTNPIIIQYTNILKKIIMGVPNNTDEPCRPSISDIISNLKELTSNINKKNYDKLIIDIESIDKNTIELITQKYNKFQLTNNRKLG